MGLGVSHSALIVTNDAYPNRGTTTPATARRAVPAGSCLPAAYLPGMDRRECALRSPSPVPSDYRCRREAQTATNAACLQGSPSRRVRRLQISREPCRARSSGPSLMLDSTRDMSAAVLHDTDSSTYDMVGRLWEVPGQSAYMVHRERYTTTYLPTDCG